ncbi:MULTISPECIES: F0F1 ATP synthase subunit A [unclassified Clostridium]|uniref:F0F1 ATP synthase subunit A n=2 Tax=Clostridium TaxID=1485 RepID=UPI002A802083|nr:F0F1 ATP synthase subunit A [Clostridium sp.]MCI6692942.1 F0F1 ATP synthase subunit A [Clostridium sp.]MDY4253382.1 F0F1 ATP synthase subunit A [Clostridium sp.]
MEPLKPLWSFNVGSIKIDIVPEIIIQWIIILIIAAIAIWATRNLPLRPNKKQVVVEYIYTTLRNVITANMGEEFLDVLPFIGSLAVFLLFMNLTGLFGLPVPTKSFSVTVGMALVTFYMVQYYTIRKYGLKSYFKGYTFPIALITPINILERIMLPVSLALRLFGNILAATFLVELCYEALGHIGFITQLGIPIPLHAYFDIFDGGIQTVIFIMLTMINIKMIADHSGHTEH